MEWKKDSISSAELERKQQEYIREAMEMLRRAKPDSTAHQPSAESPVQQENDVSEQAKEATGAVEKTEAIGEETAEAAEEAEEIIESVEAIPEAAEEITESAEEIPEAAEEITESAEEIPKSADEIPGSEEEITENTKEAPKKAETTSPEEAAEENSGKYGVYSAEELINSAEADEELKTAAEMLAEMKSKTEYMRSLAEAAEEPLRQSKDFQQGQFVCPKCGRNGGAHGRY